MGLKIVDAISSAVTEIKAKLIAAGCKNGDELTDDQIKNKSKSTVLFYRNFCQSEEGIGKNIYIVYDIFENQISGRADDTVRNINVAVRIDIWSRLDFESSVLKTLQQNIEGQFTDWEVTIDNLNYDRQNEFYSIFYNCYKNF